MDVPVARAERPAFQQRGTAGREEQRNVFARGVHGPAHHVGRTYAHVHHHGRNAPRDHGIAVRHGDGEVLVGGKNGLGCWRALLISLGIGLDDGREVRSGVAEEVIDAAACEKLEISRGNAFRFF